MKSISHYKKAIESRAKSFFYERRGFKTDRHIVVIESDDWGSIRMPSLEILHELEEKGIHFFNNFGYDTHDSLASDDDLTVLMDALSSVKDSNGNPAKLTMNCVVANPDFEKIKNSGFSEYYYELFPDTLRRYPHHDNAFSLWKEGIEKGLFKPQFHGREHLNVQMWLNLLQKGNLAAIDCFEKGVWSFNLIDRPQGTNHVLSAYNIQKGDELKFIEDSVREGLSLFEKLFGYKSESMIAPNYTWDKTLEAVAFECGVKVFQGDRTQRLSHFSYQNGGMPITHYMGEKNSLGQVYMIRNCNFEPNQIKNTTVDSVMAEVKKCFDLHKPAIISSHRQNFIGELNLTDRDKNIITFVDLLNTIVKQYSDIEFMTSVELGQLLSH